jgi:hypothetical protein
MLLNTPAYSIIQIPVISIEASGMQQTMGKFFTTWDASDTLITIGTGDVIVTAAMYTHATAPAAPAARLIVCRMLRNMAPNPIAAQ